MGDNLQSNQVCKLSCCLLFVQFLIPSKLSMFLEGFVDVHHKHFHITQGSFFWINSHCFDSWNEQLLLFWIEQSECQGFLQPGVWFCKQEVFQSRQAVEHVPRLSLQVGIPEVVLVDGLEEQVESKDIRNEVLEYEVEELFKLVNIMIK
jgi:hypothetical protein